VPSGQAKAPPRTRFQTDLAHQSGHFVPPARVAPRP
jgi:hypothetical protein